MTGLRISELRFVHNTDPKERAKGLLGWVRFDIAGLLHVDGVAVRRTRGGRITLSFPKHPDSRDVDHLVLRPISDRARREIESAVMDEIPFVHPEAQP